MLIVLGYHYILGAVGGREKQYVVLCVLSIFIFIFWQRNFSMSVNSAAVLRLTGRGGGGGTVVGAPRGRSSSRGRGELYEKNNHGREGGGWGNH